MKRHRVYGSPSGDTRETLWLPEEGERVRDVHLEWLRGEVHAGLNALDRGQSVPFDRKTVAAIKAEGRRRLARCS